MSFAILTDGVWRELAPGQDISTETFQVSYPSILLWSDAERAERGIHAIADDAIPPGKIATGSQLVDDAGAPRRTYTLADAPAPEPLRFTLYKTTVISRMTDAEVDAFDAALTGASARERRMWADCQHIESWSPYFAALGAQFAAAFGQARADAILAQE